MSKKFLKKIDRSEFIRTTEVQLRDSLTFMDFMGFTALD